MKLSEALDKLGRPIAYYPKVRHIVGGNLAASVLLCQFTYWRGKEADPNGWLKKNSDEIEEETGLSYNEQVTARKYMKDNGILTEKYFRLEHRMGFKLNIARMDKLWSDYLKTNPIK